MNFRREVYGFALFSINLRRVLKSKPLNMLKDKIDKRETGILLYGLTPPKLQHTPEKIAEISKKHAERIDGLDIDGLILYDIQDEKFRTERERPFPFMQTVEPLHYSTEYLGAVKAPKIVYQCVSKHNPDSFKEWLKPSIGREFYSVFVGTASAHQKVNISLNEAYELRKAVSPEMSLGAVAIAERHLQTGDEHLRMFAKINRGCSYFVSQAVYNLEASKNMLSDFYYASQEKEIPVVPIIVTLSPCGSLKTLQFMEWLGISIPRWLENELKHSGDILQKSVDYCLEIFEGLLDFCQEKQIPIGCNVESVAIRKEEIDASIELVHAISKMIKRRTANV